MDEFRGGQRAAGMLDDREDRDQGGMKHADEPRVEVAHIDEQDRLRGVLIARLDAGRGRFNWGKSIRNDRA